MCTCISNDFWGLLWLALFGATCFGLGFCVFGMISSWNTRTESDQHVDQIRTCGVITRMKLEKLRENYENKVAQVPEEIKRKRKMNHTEAVEEKT